MPEDKYQQWKEYGNDIKELRDKLLNIASNQKYQDLLRNKKINNELVKSLKYIDRFRNLAEEKMLQKVEPLISDEKWFTIFYGYNEEYLD